ncbi:MAG: hypothetical protein BAA01_13445 [Bacillus thermozeamaize]|uniref:Uncharacterized protein n=1 Tax=Bacillus thermozeamaize TaxID=230954 RepID=A0A1Y3PNX6_9BACI|nr:MAG: hypothetical protein BAA01_13445 [Bacillus thermozeamaize]
MMGYAKPMLLECGNSEDIIRGECGFGLENITLDKTGAYKTTKYIWDYGAPFVCPGPGVINICRRCELTTADCSTAESKC